MTKNRMIKNKMVKNRMIKTVAIVISVLLVGTGCSDVGLGSYQEAVNKTESISTGENKVEVELNTVFNKTGLTFEEEKKLSVFENMKSKINIKYDETDDFKLETDIYYIIGAYGIDMSAYYNEDTFFMRMPFINSFMVIDDADFVSGDNVNDSSDDEGTDGDTGADGDTGTDANYNDSDTGNNQVTIDFDLISKQWLEILKEDNVVVGDNTYLITNEGQIKTTTYQFNLDAKQLEQLLAAIIKSVDIEQVNEMIKENMLSAGADEEDINEFDVRDVLDDYEFTELNGEAYVDFDGRLTRQYFELKGVGADPVPGNVESFTISYQIDYSKLGEKIEFDFPELTDENTVTSEELNQLFETIDNLN